MRKLSGPLKTILGIWSALIAIFFLYTAVFGAFQPRLQRGISLLFLLPLGFLMYPATKKSPQDRPSVLDFVFAIASMASTLYIIIFNDTLNMRLTQVDPVTTVELILGAINIVLIIEAIRRAVVPAMAILIGAFIAYTWVAPFLPGVFYARPISIARLVEMCYLGTDVGIYGSLSGIMATFVAVFVIFSSFMEGTNTGVFFTNFASRIAGRGPGGGAKIAVVASGLFGTISGVGVANMYATGTFTIPLMKRLGYRPQFAAAVAASSSTGGQLMPPIMGAAAFVMSEISGIPYWTIALAAALPATFYYISIFMRVHFVALRDNLKPMDEKDMLPWKQLIKDSYLLLPLVALVVMLSIGYSPFKSCVIAIATTFALSFLNKNTMLTPKKLFKVFESSGFSCIMLAITCAGAGLVISVITYTGLGLGIATVVARFSGGFLLPALMLIMITCIIMGLGMPCTPAYIISVVIGAPAMNALGIATLPAHLFVFYFAILAELTPPDAIVAYCASTIAGSDPWKTGWEASFLGIMGYIIPFVFIYNGAIILHGPIYAIIATTLILFMAVAINSAAVTKFLFKPIGAVTRILLWIAAAGLVVLACQEKFLATFSYAMIVIIVGGAFLVAYTLMNRKLVKRFAVEHA
ncbi:MAG TPA: TRAP transporter fused permease subunit [Rectinemataceae bacterium]|nr:TRAP transporter fused permease subunit [Rectinemataceae bacterium]